MKNHLVDYKVKIEIKSKLGFRVKYFSSNENGSFSSLEKDRCEVCLKECFHSKSGDIQINILPCYRIKKILKNMNIKFVSKEEIYLSFDEEFDIENNMCCNCIGELNEL